MSRTHPPGSSSNAQTSTLNVSSTTTGGSSSSSAVPVRKGAEFLCRVKFKNTLPELPFEPKCLTYPLDVTRYVRYWNMTLAKWFKYDLHMRPSLGIHIDLVEPAKYMNIRNDPLDPADMQIINAIDETVGSRREGLGKSKRPTVTWLRRTEYIAAESAKWIGTKVDAEARGVARSHPVEGSMTGKEMTREGQIRMIEKTFSAAQQKPIHPTKPQLTAVEVLSIFPDFVLWPNEYSLCVFDDDPAFHVGKSDSIRPFNEEEKRKYAKTMDLENWQTHHALLKPMKNPGVSEGTSMVYFLPDRRTTQRKRSIVDEKLDPTTFLAHTDSKEGSSQESIYEAVREYTVKTTKEDRTLHYFFVQRANGIYYNALSSRIQLQKRRNRGRVGTRGPVTTHESSASPRSERPTLIRLCQRTMTDEECLLKRQKLNDLEYIPSSEMDPPRRGSFTESQLHTTIHSHPTSDVDENSHTLPTLLFGK